MGCGDTYTLGHLVAMLVRRIADSSCCGILTNPLNQPYVDFVACELATETLTTAIGASTQPTGRINFIISTPGGPFSPRYTCDSGSPSVEQVLMEAVVGVANPDPTLALRVAVFGECTDCLDDCGPRDMSYEDALRSCFVIDSDGRTCIAASALGGVEIDESCGPSSCGIPGSFLAKCPAAPGGYVIRCLIM